jgi:hypothetical protein
MFQQTAFMHREMKRIVNNILVIDLFIIFILLTSTRMLQLVEGRYRIDG